MMGELTFFLGIQVKQMKQCTFIHQAKYTKDLMKKFNMAKLKPVSTLMCMATLLDPNENGEVSNQREYRSMIGSIMCITTTRLDIQFTMCLCARFESSPCSSHRIAIQRISGISSTHSSLGFVIPLLLHLILLAFSILILRVVGFTERALLVLVIFLDLSCMLVFSKTIFNCSIHHRGRVCSRCSQILWIVHTIRDFGVIFERIPLMCDNTSAISVAKNSVFHKRMRHLRRRRHFLIDHVEKGDIEMRYIDTERQFADIFTKPFDASRFAALCLCVCGGGISVCHPYCLV
jgi:hypothetical protein